MIGINYSALIEEVPPTPIGPYDVRLSTSGISGGTFYAYTTTSRTVHASGGSFSFSFSINNDNSDRKTIYISSVTVGGSYIGIDKTDVVSAWSFSTSVAGDSGSASVPAGRYNSRSVTLSVGRSYSYGSGPSGSFSASGTQSSPTPGTGELNGYNIYVSVSGYIVD